MKRICIAVSSVALLLVAASVQAASLDLNLGEESVQLEANGDIAPGVTLGGGWLDSDDREDVTMAHAQLLGTERTSRYDVGIGARWSQFDAESRDGGGLGLGGYGYAYLPAAPAVSLGGYGFYTPDAMTAGDLEESLEVGLRARYAFTANTDAYLGYRRLRADFDDVSGTRTLDSGPHAGVRIRF